MTKLYRVAKRSTDVSTGGADSTKAVRFDLEKFETDENEQECAEPIVTNIQVCTIHATQKTLKNLLIRNVFRAFSNFPSVVCLSK